MFLCYKHSPVFVSGHKSTETNTGHQIILRALYQPLRLMYELGESLSSVNRVYQILPFFSIMDYVSGATNKLCSQLCGWNLSLSIAYFK